MGNKWCGVSTYLEIQFWSFSHVQLHIEVIVMGNKWSDVDTYLEI